MSFADFNRGLTSEEVRKKKLSANYEDEGQARLRKWKESAHVLSFVRSLKESKEAFDKLELEAWQKATRRR